MIVLSVIDASILALIISIARTSVDDEVECPLSFDEASEFCQQGMKLVGQIVSMDKSSKSTKDQLFERISLLGKLFKSENYLVLIVDYLHSLADFNAFIGFMETTLKELFESTGGTDNGLCGPTKITETSVLGIFVRSIRAQWSAFEFAQQCSLYNDYRAIIGEFSVEAIEGSAQTISTDRSTKDTTHLTPWTNQMIDKIDIACQNQDTAQAEFLIHHLFDTSPHDPLRKLTRKDFQSLQLFVQDLEQSISGGSKLRSNQSAMITLAVLWLRVGNLERAYIAIEEALKTAHHSGDHPSVVRCLLILFHIFQKDDNLVDCEEIIYRCIVRAGALKMHEAVAEAALILATLKLQALSVSNENENTKSVNSNSSDSIHKNITNDSLINNSKNNSNATSTSWTLREVLNIILYALHGETSCTVKYCLTKEAITIEDTMSGAASMMTAAQQSAAGKAWPVSEELPKNDVNYANFSLRCACVQAELWMKVHNPQMASFVIARMLNVQPRQAHMEVVAYSLLKKLTAEVEGLCQRYLQQDDEGGGSTPQVTQEAFVALLRKYRTIQKLVSALPQVTASDPAQQTYTKYAKCMVNMAVDMIAFFCAVLAREWDRAARFSDKLAQGHATNPLSQYSLPLLEMLDHHRFTIWHHIVSLRCMSGPCEGHRMMLQVENRMDGNSSISSSLNYLMYEHTVKFLLKLSST